MYALRDNPKQHASSPIYCASSNIAKCDTRIYIFNESRATLTLSLTKASSSTFFAKSLFFCTYAEYGTQSTQNLYLGKQETEITP